LLIKTSIENNLCFPFSNANYELVYFLQTPRHCWRETGTRFQPENVAERFHSGRKSVSVWGWMARGGVGHIQKIEGHLTAVQYVEILEEMMLPSVWERFPHQEEIVFVQDNCSIHTARVVKEWFEEHQEILVVPWPAKSPDLNPIQNVWADMAREWKHVSPNDHLIFDQCLTSWEAVTARFCQASVDSMRRGLEEVIRLEGHWTGH